MAGKDTDQPQKTQVRWAAEHMFRFHCHPDVSCFTRCCQDVTIVLTPYDVVRMKNAIGVSSEEFLDKYTVIIPKKGRLIPLVVLKMNEEDKRCTFVSEEGCRIYDDRPWPCRMYPLDLGDDGSYHLITDETRCHGLNESDTWTIEDWLTDQGTAPYNEMNESLTDITVPLQAAKLAIDNPQISQMVFMALYNIDKFREFVFNSSFLDRFELEDPTRIEKIKSDDLELLKFAFDWIKFGLLGEKLFWVKENADKEGRKR